MSESAAFLSDWVFPQASIRQWVLSVPIPLRYWMARNPELTGKVLAIMIRAISGFQRRKAASLGMSHGQSGSVTMIQRAGGSINLNVHFHTLFIETVYREGEQGRVEECCLPEPSTREVSAVLKTIQKRVVRLLIRKGYLDERGEIVQDMSHPEACSEEVLPGLQEASVANRIASGKHAGERVRRLGNFGNEDDHAWTEGVRCAALGGFSLHANTGVKADRRDKLEKLCRYIARPPVAEQRLFERSDGQIEYHFKKAWADGTRAVLFSPTELIEKLAALIPQPRTHQIRFHGVLAPNSALRARVVPPPSSIATAPNEETGKSQGPRKGDPRRLKWAELLKRVFQIDLSVCPDCGGSLEFIAAILGRCVIVKILEHLGLSSTPPRFEPARAPPQFALDLAHVE